MFNQGWIRKGKRLLRDFLAVLLAWRDPSVPRTAKFVGLGALVYLFLPMDIIPDVIPVVGWLDDLAMMPLAAYLASRIIPIHLMDELRDRADVALLRHGPRLKRIAVIFLAAWLLLACFGAMLFWRNQSRTLERESQPDAYEQFRPKAFQAEGEQTMQQR